MGWNRICYRPSATEAASKARVYTRRVLVGGYRPQAPVKTGEVAPVLLSRLRRLLPLDGGGKSSFPLLTVTLGFFLSHTQNALHIIFFREQLHHLFLCLLVFRIPFFVLDL